MADVKTAYGSSSALTITLASLASSSGLTAGRASTAIDNTTNKYLDYIASGKVTTGTSPTAARSILVYVYGSMNDTPDYPDGITGSDAAKTMTSADIRNSGLVLAAAITTDSTSNRTYPIRPFSVASCFGGKLPKFWGLFVVHDTGVALHATGSNHAFYSTPVYETVA
jgi:hypothetical protein